MQRTFEIDVLQCPKCRGRLRIVEAVVETTAALDILKRLGMWTEYPRPTRARDPTSVDVDSEEHDDDV